jgi:hypothetical protein
MGNFQNYVIFKEFGEYLKSNIDDIKFGHETIFGRDCFTYKYTIDNEDYVAKFCQRPIYFHGESFADIEVTDNAYEISFASGSKSTRPTGKMTGTRVYGPLIMALRKLIQEKNPEGLHFSGAYIEQDLMYQAFYERYLKKAYTRIAGADYLRNDFIQSLKAANDERWQVVGKGIENMRLLQPDQRETLLKAKDKKRRRYARLVKAVGKIVNYGEPLYLSKVTPEEAIGLSSFGGTVYPKPHISHNMISPYTSQQYINLKTDLVAFQQLLDLKKGLKNVQIWVDDTPNDLAPRGWETI